MKFAIFTHVPHIFREDSCYAYGPYVKEMNIWFKHVDEVIIVAPKSKTEILKIDLPYLHDRINFEAIPSFSLTSLKSIFSTLIVLPKVFWTTFMVMQKTDHIHLRCPGNAGLVACLVQILFPSKPKTAKYAGNWDPKSKQPWSYRLQKWILSNTFLTRNIKVLVYGEWEGSTKNIVPFFTATYKERDKISYQEKSLSNKIQFLFVGTLSQGKQPMYALQLVESLKKKGHDVLLNFYGDGVMKNNINNIIEVGGMQHYVKVNGNQNQETVKGMYLKSHFLILPSKSEGWPKVVAEAMFFGCLPIVSNVSCVSTMLEDNERGCSLSFDLAKDVDFVENLILNPKLYNIKAEKALNWSQKFTLEYFEEEIWKILFRG